MSNKGLDEVAATGADFLPDLHAVSGLDVPTALNHLRGRTERYLHLLRTFVDGRTRDMEAMRQCIATRDYPQLRALAHSLKGVSGFLGARDIHDLATELDSALRTEVSDEDVARHAGALIAAQAELRDQVLGLLANTPAT